MRTWCDASTLLIIGIPMLLAIQAGRIAYGLAEGEA